MVTGESLYVELLDNLFFKCFPYMSPEDISCLSYTEMASKILNYHYKTNSYKSGTTTKQIAITLNGEVIWTPSNFDGTNFHELLWRFVDKDIIKLKLDILTETTND